MRTEERNFKKSLKTPNDQDNCFEVRLEFLESYLKTQTIKVNVVHCRLRSRLWSLFVEIMTVNDVKLK